MSLSPVDSFCDQVGDFVMRHKLLCALTLGFAIAAYALGKLGERTVAWLKESLGTTKKAAEVAQRALKEDPPPSESYETPPPPYDFPTESYPTERAHNTAPMVTPAPVLPSAQKVQEIMASLERQLPEADEKTLAAMEERENVAHEILPGLFLARRDLNSSVTFNQIFSLIGLYDIQGDYPHRKTVVGIEMDHQTHLEKISLDEITKISFPMQTYDTNRLTLACFRMEKQRYLQMAIHHIDRTLRGKKTILVLGELGQHLSTTLVAAYIISKYKVSPPEAIHYIRTKRLYANPDGDCVNFLTHEFRTLILPPEEAADV